MVYMSGGKMARNAASIVNRQNVCGGMKKPGLAPSVGSFLSRLFPFFIISYHSSSSYK